VLVFRTCTIYHISAEATKLGRLRAGKGSVSPLVIRFAIMVLVLGAFGQAWAAASSPARTSAPVASGVTVVLVPTTHMDIDFTRPPAGSMRLYAGFINRAIKALEGDCDLRYSVQLASAVDAFARHYPDSMDRLAALVRNGQVEICANWTNPHYSELSGETVIRQIAWTKWWVHKRLGVWPTVADNGELADVTPQLAQVLAGSEVPYFHSYKTVYLPKQGGRPGYRGSMWFVALDGSRVLFNADTYNLGCDFNKDRPWSWPGGKTAGVRGIEACRTGRAGLFTVGGEGWDDCLPQFEKLIQFVRGWNGDPQTSRRARYVMGTWADFFAAVKEQADAGLTLPVRTGHTEHGEIIYRWIWNLSRDRAMFETVMPQAEALAAWCDWLDLDGADAAATDSAWQLLLESCTHNWGKEDRKSRLLTRKASDARAAAEKLRDESLGKLASAAAGDGQVLVANTLTHPRREAVRIGDSWRIIDLPAFGYVTVPADAPPEPAGDLKVEKDAIENAFYRVTASPADGLTSIYDKRRRKELLRPVAGKSVLEVRSSYSEVMGAENTYIRPSDPTQAAALKAYRAWGKSTDARMVVREVSTARKGAAAQMTLTGRTGRTRTTITVRLVSGMGCVETSFDSGGAEPSATQPLPDARLAEELRGGPMFFATIELNLPDGALARTSVPFGSVGLPKRIPQVLQATEQAFSGATADAGATGWVGVYDEGWHVPLEDLFGARACQPRWTTLWSSSGGITWCQRAPYANMFRDRKRPTRFHKSLWRGSAGSGKYVWRLISHDGDWRKANAPRLAAELNAPLLTATPAGAADKRAPGRASWLTVDSPNVVFSALRRSFDGKGYVLRFFEAHDRAGKVRVERSGPLAEMDARLTNILERVKGAALADGSVAVSPFEIVTLRLAK